MTVTNFTFFLAAQTPVGSPPERNLPAGPQPGNPHLLPLPRSLTPYRRPPPKAEEPALKSQRPDGPPMDAPARPPALAARASAP